MAQKNPDPEIGRAEVEAYIARVPEPGRTTLEKMRALISAAAPGEATEQLSYRIPAFHFKGALLSYAASKITAVSSPWAQGPSRNWRKNLRATA